LQELRRIVELCIAVYREDNPDDNASDWLLHKGFWRRLYAGKHGKWPYPETLGTDQMAPLLFGLLMTREHLVDSTCVRNSTKRSLAPCSGTLIKFLLSVSYPRCRASGYYADLHALTSGSKNG